MARRILFAVDFSPYTEKLLGCAGELARLGLNEVILLYVFETRKHVDYGDEKNPAHVEERREAEDHLQRLAASLEEQGLRVKRIMKQGSPADVIVNVAREEDAYLIFVGAHGKGFLDRITVGSVSEKVLKTADRPVLIQHCRHVRESGGYTCENVCTTLFGNVLVANDFSEYAENVKPLLRDLAEALCAPVTLLHVHEERVRGDWEPAGEPLDQELLEEMERLQCLSNDLSDCCRSTSVAVIKGSPAEAILGYAEEIDASLIVLGAFGRRGVFEGMLGSVTEKVARDSERPVLVLKDR